MSCVSICSFLAASAISAAPAETDGLQAMAAIDWQIDHRWVAPGALQDSAVDVDGDADPDLEAPPGHELEADEEWRVNAQPYIWIPASIKADSTVAGSTASIDLTFSDVLDNFDEIFAITGRVEAWKGRWGILFDGMYVSIEGNFNVTPPPPAPVQFGLNVEIAQSFVDLGVGWIAVDQRIEKDDAEDMRFRVDLLGGLRYQYLKQEITPSFGPTLGRSEDWMEIMIGFRAGVQVNEHLIIGGRADVSGFSIGSGSDHTWNLYGGVDIIFSPTFDLKLGYRILDMDYTNGNGMAEFGLDTRMHGPYIGASFRF